MIQAVSREFIPAAINLYKIRESKDAGGELFRSIQKQRPQYQGIWIVSPEGQVLAAHHEIKSHATWSEEILSTIQTARQAIGPITPRKVSPRDPLPHRGFGTVPGGDVNLAVYSRYVRGGGQSAAPPSTPSASLWLWDGEVRADGPPVIDTLSLTGEEWRGFGPPKLVAGTEWSIPAAVSRKFARALSPSSDQSTMPRPDEAVVSDLKARVESLEGAEVRIRLTGRWETKHIYLEKPSYAWATAEGFAVYDARQKVMRSLTLLLSGSYRMAPPYDTADRPIGAVIEWKSNPP